MALSGDILGDLMLANLDAALAAMSDDAKRDDSSRRRVFFRALGAATVTHILTAGVVVVVTACPAGAGSGSGTVT